MPDTTEGRRKNFLQLQFLFFKCRQNRLLYLVARNFQYNERSIACLAASFSVTFYTFLAFCPIDFFVFVFQQNFNTKIAALTAACFFHFSVLAPALCHFSTQNFPMAPFYRGAVESPTWWHQWTQSTYYCPECTSPVVLVADFFWLLLFLQKLPPYFKSYYFYSVSVFSVVLII